STWLRRGSTNGLSPERRSSPPASALRAPCRRIWSAGSAPSPARCSRARAAASWRQVPSGSHRLSANAPHGIRRFFVAEHRIVPEVDRLAASRRALERRRARAAIKRDLTTRVTTGQEVLRRAVEDADSDAATMRVTDFLLALPAIGTGKRDRILEELHISPVKRLGGLGVRQLAALSGWLDERFPPHTARPGRSRLLVLAGPTAVGKGTVAAHIRESHPQIHLSVSATTRSPRPGEIDGVHYYFVDDEAFDRLIAEGQLLEHATVHNRYRYGTPRGPVDEALAQGKTVLLEID